MKQDARIAELETQSTRPSQDTRTDDDLLRFLDKQDQWLINGELEESRDGKVRWTYTHELNSYDGDDEWESMDATDTLLDLIRHIRNPSHKNIREPVVFRVPLKNPSSSIYLEACNRERTKWVVRCAGKVDKYLNKDGEWETSADLYPEFLRKFSWPTKEEARNAFLARPEPLTVVQKQAARIAELEALLQEKTVKREP